MGSAHREAFAALQWALRDANGFGLVVGGPGTGKTSLLLDLLKAECDGVRILIWRPSPFEEMLRRIASRLEIEESNVDAAELAQQIKDKLDALNTRAVLIFDEAQALDDATLESLRLFTNDSANATARIQILFVAQPELRERLKQPALRALDQRIATRAELLPLRRSEIREYIAHRLLKCGGSIDKLFTRRAVQALIRNEVRVPREINLVCHGAFILAYGRRSAKITAATVLDSLHEYRGAFLSRVGSFQYNWSYLKATYRKVAILVGVMLISLVLLPAASGNVGETPLQLGQAQHATRGVDCGPILPTPAHLAVTFTNDLYDTTEIHKQRLKEARSVVVREGDSLSSIAATILGSRDPKTVNQLIKVNPQLTNLDLIYPHQTIFLLNGHKT